MSASGSNEEQVTNILGIGAVLQKVVAVLSDAGRGLPEVRSAMLMAEGSDAQDGATETLRIADADLTDTLGRVANASETRYGRSEGRCYEGSSPHGI